MSNSALTHVALCNIPSFDWTRARYSSRYVAFVHADMLRSNGLPFQPLTKEERALYGRYSQLPGSTPGDPLNARATALNATSERTLPLIAAGGYLQTLSQTLAQGDFEEFVSVPDATPINPDPKTGTAYPSGLSFASIHNTLYSGHEPKYSQLAFQVNAEANIMTALICHADGMQPRGVCRRPAIQRLVKRIR